jgi:integrase
VGKVTVSAINKLEGWLWDPACVGFGARRQRNSVFFYVRYRLNGSQVVKSIGRNGSPWTCDTARTEAKRLLGIVASGVDPFAQSLSSETFGAEVERYLARKQPSIKPRSFIEIVRHLRNYALPLHKLRLAEIDRRTIAVLLGQVETSSGAVTRNRMRSALSAFFAWTIQEGLTELNPVQGTGKADEGGSRDRVLSPAELRKLWCSLGEDKFSDVVRLLLLTAQRRTEIGKLAWSEIDFDRKLITLPADRVKNSRSQELPLSRQALAVIEHQPRTTDFVFGGKKGFQDWAAAKATLDQRIGIAPWRLHDLRRTAATYMAEIGILPHIVEAVLNHVSGHKASVAGIYNRAKYADEMRSALQRWADYVDKITA